MGVVAVVGLGYVGSVIAAVLASKGVKIRGIDTNQTLVDAIVSGECPVAEPGLKEILNDGLESGRLNVSTDAAAVAGAEAVLITVGTPLSEAMEADIGHIRAVCEGIAPYMSDGQLVMVKSTVPPGVTRAMYDEVLSHHAAVHMVFSPERLAEGRAIAEFSALPMVVGGVNGAATEVGAKFWQSILPVEVIRVSSSEAAELVKLADNLWIDVNIALGNELAKLCDRLPCSLDVLEIIRGANSLKKGQHYVNILTPSNGVGGYCLTKDPWFIDAIASDVGLSLALPCAGRASNDSMPNHVFEQVDGFLKGRGLRVDECPVAVLGYSFKTNSGDCRSTPVSPLLKRFRAAGYGSGLRVFDPLVTNAEARERGEELESDWETAVKGAKAILFLTGHEAFARISITKLAEKAAEGALVYDGRFYFSREQITEIEGAGMVYMGVGRYGVAVPKDWGNR